MEPTRTKTPKHKENKRIERQHWELDTVNRIQQIPTNHWKLETKKNETPHKQMRLLEGRKAGTGQEGRMMEDGALMHVWRGDHLLENNVQCDITASTSGLENCFRFPVVPRCHQKSATERDAAWRTRGLRQEKQQEKSQVKEYGHRKRKEERNHRDKEKGGLGGGGRSWCDELGLAPDLQ